MTLCNGYALNVKETNNKYTMANKMDKLAETIDQLVYKISNMEQHIY